MYIQGRLDAAVCLGRYLNLLGRLGCNDISRRREGYLGTSDVQHSNPTSIQLPCVLLDAKPLSMHLNMESAVILCFQSIK